MLSLLNFNIFSLRDLMQLLKGVIILSTSVFIFLKASAELKVHFLKVQKLIP